MSRRAFIVTPPIQCGRKQKTQDLDCAWGLMMRTVFMAQRQNGDPKAQHLDFCG